jgi:hypothetical protein
LKQSGATAFIPRIWSALKSFDDQAAFGLPYERLIAQTAALLLYPHRLDLTLVRLDAYAALDFLLVDGETPVAALEVKRRAVRSDTYRTTILPQSVVDAAKRLTVPTFAAILFTDGLAVFDVLRTPSTARWLRDRRGRARKHREYDIRERMVRIEALHQRPQGSD